MAAITLPLPTFPPFPSITATSTPSSTSSNPTTTTTTSGSSLSKPASSGLSSVASTPSSSQLTSQTTPPVNTPPGVVTVTSVVSTTSSLDPSPTSQTPTSTSFFQNKGAVAGVFTIVGLVGVVGLVVLITNAVRRRRALKFDRDVAEAAAEAAKAPIVLDDDYESGYGHHGSSGSAPFSHSDVSHPSYGQPPMSHHESYGMSEMGEVVPVHHQAYDPFSAGAAGYGANMARGQNMQSVPGMYDQQPYQNLARAPSNPNNLYYAGPAPYADHSPALQAGASQMQYQAPPPAAVNYGTQYQPGGPPADAPNGGGEAYGGYVAGDQPARRSSGMILAGNEHELPNPFASATSPPPPPTSPPLPAHGAIPDSEIDSEDGHHARNQSFGGEDEEDYEKERANRVLKVTNE